MQTVNRIIFLELLTRLKYNTELYQPFLKLVFIYGFIIIKLNDSRLKSLNQLLKKTIVVLLLFQILKACIVSATHSRTEL